MAHGEHAELQGLQPDGIEHHAFGQRYLQRGGALMLAFVLMLFAQFAVPMHTGAPASAPVSLPTIGYTTIGGTVDTPSNNFMVGSYFTASATGTYNGTFHLYSGGGGASAAVCGVYATSGGTASGQALLASSSITIASGAAWYTGAINVSVTASTLYYFACSGSNSNFRMNYDTGPAGSQGYAAFTYTGSMPNPAPTLTSDVHIYSVYVSNL